MSGFTDYHAHFVYGVDDGAQTREEMYAMLDAAVADGVRHLFATSHSTPGMERFPQEIYDRHLALARAYCTQKGYDLKLEHGSELLYTPATGYAAVQRQLLTLGDTGWVLLEFVPNITAKELETALQEITGAGYRILDKKRNKKELLHSVCAAALFLPAEDLTRMIYSDMILIS